MTLMCYSSSPQKNKSSKKHLEPKHAQWKPNISINKKKTSTSTFLMDSIPRFFAPWLSPPFPGEFSVFLLVASIKQSQIPGTVYIHNCLPLKRCVFPHLFGPLPPWQRKKIFQPPPLQPKTPRFRQKLCQLGKIPQQNDGDFSKLEISKISVVFCLTARTVLWSGSQLCIRIPLATLAKNGGIINRMEISTHQSTHRCLGFVYSFRGIAQPVVFSDVFCLRVAHLWQVFFWSLPNHFSQIWVRLVHPNTSHPITQAVT